jgi:hypothetical protein
MVQLEVARLVVVEIMAIFARGSRASATRFKVLGLSTCRFDSSVYNLGRSDYLGSQTEEVPGDARSESGKTGASNG